MIFDRNQFKVINDLKEWNTILVDNQYIIENIDFVDVSEALMVQISYNQNFLSGL